MSLRIALEGIPKAIYWGTKAGFSLLSIDIILPQLILFLAYILILLLFANWTNMPVSVPSTPPPRWDKLLLGLPLCFLGGFMILWVTCYLASLAPLQVDFEADQIVLGERQIVITMEDLISIKFSESESIFHIHLHYRQKSDLDEHPMDITKNETTSSKMNSLRAWCERKNVTVEIA